MHTHLCGHAVGETEDYVRHAAAVGLGLVTFTCHIPMREAGFGGPRIRMDHDRLPEYYERVARARELGAELGVEVLCGIEAEISPFEAANQEVAGTLAANDFDFVLGSLHHQLEYFRRWLVAEGLAGDAEIARRYFEVLAAGARSGLYHSIAHPDVIRIYGTIREFEPEDHEAVIRDFLQAALDADTCIEVNTSGLLKGVYTVHPDPLILGWAREMGVRLTLGSDAHRPEGVGQMFGEVLPMLLDIGFTHLHYFRKGERTAIPIETHALT